MIVALPRNRYGTGWCGHLFIGSRWFGRGVRSPLRVGMSESTPDPFFSLPTPFFFPSPAKDFSEVAAPFRRTAVTEMHRWGREPVHGRPIYCGCRVFVWIPFNGYGRDV